MKIKMLTAMSVIIAVLLVVTSAFAGNGIRGTLHDLSSHTGEATLYGAQSEQSGLDRVCIYCHAPHFTLKPSDAAVYGYTYVPLWNHDITLQPTFTYYSNGGNPMDSAHSAPTSYVIGSVSKLCLSCHDGSIATASYGNAGGVSLGLTYALATSHNVGTVNLTNTFAQIGAGGDLSNHHPIGFNYSQAYQQHGPSSDFPSLNDPSVAILAPLAGGGGLTVNAMLSNSGTMECNTCHDVHDINNGTAEMFLWQSDTHSNLCLVCHLK